MAPPSNKPPAPAGAQNGPKKKGFNPYNKFKNRHWKKKKNPDDNGDKTGGANHTRNSTNTTLASPTKIVQTPISMKL